MLAALLKDVGLPSNRGQLLGCLPTVCQSRIPSILAGHNLVGKATHFSPEEVLLQPNWLDLTEEILTEQKGLCDKLRRKLADRDHVLMTVQCTENEARALLDDLWALGAECLCYWDEWRVHFDYVTHSTAEVKSEEPPPEGEEIDFKCPARNSPSS